MPNAFELLSRPIQRALADRGFSGPTEPQARAMPIILQGKSVLLIAPTGTGKTEAAFLPILDRLLAMPRGDGIKFLYITPLRALNRDMLDRLTWWCQRLDIRLGVRHGDTEAKERTAQSLAPPDLLITTPETLQAILVGRRMREHLRKLRWVVVDEVHELAGDKRGSQLALGMERLRGLTEDFQVVGLSATIGTPERVARFLVGTERPCEVVRVPVARAIKLRILYPRATPADEELASKLYTHPEVAARLRVMRTLIDGHRSTLLFTNTRSTAEVLSSRFRVWDIEAPIGIHHGSLSKPSRVSAERELKEGRLKGIVCTSSLELGIDIGALDLVLQYNSPRQVTRLLQRVGRSGHRIGGVARGVIVTQDSDDFLESAVITRRALLEELEPVAVPEKPMDALCHQLAGLLIERRRWTFDEVLGAFRKAYPYRDLTEGELVQVLTYMNGRYPRLAFLSPGERVLIKPRQRGDLYRYYFENLSMIPEEKQFLVIEEGGDPIGVLDEAFVAEHGEIGTKFIERGSAWRILEVYGDKIYVKGEEDPAGAIPSWIGEEIPVPYEVAMEVGRVRGRAEEGLRDGKSIEAVAGVLAEEYPCDASEMERGLEEVAEQVTRGTPVPTDRLITLEAWEGYVIIHAPFGLLVNRTLSRVLGHLLSEELGAVVGVQPDAYRNVLRGSAPLEKVDKLLRELPGRDLEALALRSLLKTGVFKRRLLHVARKFGALAKGADLSSVSLSKLMEGFRGTAIYEEAARSTLASDADIESARRALGLIASGAVGIAKVEGLTPVGRIGMAEMGRKYDLIPPEKMRSLLVESARARLLGEARTLVCTNCWGYVEVARVQRLPERPTCPRCSSGRLGVLEEGEEKIQRLCERRRRKEEVALGYRKLLERASKTGELVERYGRDAVLALATRGLAIQEVRETLAGGPEGLVERVMEAERRALRRRFFVARAKAPPGGG